MRSIGTLISEASRALFNDPGRAGRIREDKQKHKMDLLTAEVAGNLERQKLANEGQLATQNAQNQGSMDVMKLKGDIEQSLRESQIAENMGRVGYYEKVGQASLNEANSKAGLYDEQAKGLANNNFLESTFGRDITLESLKNKQLANEVTQLELGEKKKSLTTPPVALEKASDAEFMSEWARRRKIKGAVQADPGGEIGSSADNETPGTMNKLLRAVSPLFGAANFARDLYRR